MRVTAAVEGGTVTAFIEGAVRAALVRTRQDPPHEPYRVEPFAGESLRPGVDLDDNAALLDLMDADARP